MTFRIEDVELDDVPQPEKEKKSKPKSDKKEKSNVKRPTYNESTYSKNPLTQVLNDGAASLINATTLKGYKEKVKGSELKFGQAAVFCMDYYLPQLSQNHPAWIVLAAFSGALMVVQDKKTKGVINITPQEDTGTGASDIAKMGGKSK